jgi:hypothetical protein
MTSEAFYQNSTFCCATLKTVYITNPIKKLIKFTLKFVLKKKYISKNVNYHGNINHKQISNAILCRLIEQNYLESFEVDSAIF